MSICHIYPFINQDNLLVREFNVGVFRAAFIVFKILLDFIFKPSLILSLFRQIYIITACSERVIGLLFRPVKDSCPLINGNTKLNG